MKSTRLPQPFNAGKDPIVHLRIVESEPVFDQDETLHIDTTHKTIRDIDTFAETLLREEVSKGYDEALERVRRPFRLDDYESGR